MSRHNRLAIATYRGRPDASRDDGLLIAELNARGLEVVAAPWDTLDPDRNALDGVLIRSCWDYHVRLDEFLAWVSKLESRGIPLWNSPALLRWNARKDYLRELERGGIRAVPTVWVDHGSAASLGDILAERRWPEAVVKPLVSASAHQTWRTQGETDRDEERFRALVSAGGAMVQPYQAEILAGEWSLVFIGGRYSHAALKVPVTGDFRVQAQYGGRVVPGAPAPGVVDTASRVVFALPVLPLYARVDGFIDGSGDLVLMEVELIEPELFLGLEAMASSRLADVLIEALTPRGSTRREGDSRGPPDGGPGRPLRRD